MSRSCSLCAREERAAIDAGLAAGKESLAQLARRFDTTKPTMARHRKHLADKIAVAQRASHAALVADGTTLAEQLRWIISEAKRLKEAAEGDKDYRTAMQGLREIVRVLELLADIAKAERETPAEQYDFSVFTEEERHVLGAFSVKLKYPTEAAQRRLDEVLLAAVKAKQGAPS